VKKICERLIKDSYYEIEIDFRALDTVCPSRL
jgi:hypothetical protein